MGKPNTAPGWQRTPLFILSLALLGIAVLTAIGPEEKTLGSNVRVVYLHGVWVWASLAAFLAAALSGTAGLVLQRPGLMRWSRALGRTGLIFWISYLPISIWAMQANWNGLFMAEPRFRLAVIFSITGLLLQLGVTLLENPAWASAGNLAYAAVLLIALRSTQNVMHPPAPILNSRAPLIQGFFALLLALTLLATWQVTRWIRALEPDGPVNPQKAGGGEIHPSSKSPLR